jgi:transketolase
MRAMPNMAVIVPADSVELRQALAAALHRNGPTYLRICRNPTPVLFADAAPFEFGKIRQLRDGGDLTIAVCGVPTSMAIEAADRLAARGIAVDLLEVSTLKPIDAAGLAASARKTGRVLTVEEHTIVGGLGSAVAEALAQSAPAALRMIGIQDTFTESGDYTALLRKYGISADHIETGAMQLVEANSR